MNYAKYHRMLCKGFFAMLRSLCEYPLAAETGVAGSADNERDMIS